jgi:hypothetical protein
MCTALVVAGLPIVLSATHARATAPRGSLTELSGRGSCIAEPSRTPPLPRIPGCSNAGRALKDAGPIAVSGDGRSVYVVATQPTANGIAVFSGAGRRGALRQLSGERGCLVPGPPATPIPGCTNGQKAILTPNELEVSSDGRFLYSASANSNALAVFARNRSTGALRQLAGQSGCISRGRRSPCPGARSAGRLETPLPSRSALTGGRCTPPLSSESPFSRVTAPPEGSSSFPDGRAVSSRGSPVTSSPAADHRRGRDTASAVTVSPDGRYVYATATGDPSQGAITVFFRNRSSGAIAKLPGKRGCIVNRGRRRSAAAPLAAPSRNRRTSSSHPTDGAPTCSLRMASRSSRAAVARAPFASFPEHVAA